MTKDELIVEQALRIARYEKSLNDYQERMHNIHMRLVCVGGPLNDNKLGFTKEQQTLLYYINEQSKP